QEDNLRNLEQQHAELTEASPRNDQTKPITFGRFLSPETTKLRVKPTLNMQPLPTGVYHLIDPDDSAANSLLTVLVRNEDSKIRRICLKAYLEGLSSEAVRTVEIKPRKEVSVHLLPALVPERAKEVTEIQRAALHLIVDDLDGKIESHDTFSIV